MRSYEGVRSGGGARFCGGAAGVFSPFKRSALMLALVSAAVVGGAVGSAPARAQVPTTDGAHIAMQIGQWTENVVQWGMDAQRWISQMKSSVQGKFDDLVNQYADIGATHAMTLDEVVQKIKADPSCDKIKDDTAHGLCLTERTYRVNQMQALANVMKTVDEDQKAIDQAVGSYNQLSDQVKAAVNALSVEGGSSQQGELESRAKDLDNKMKKLANDMEVANSIASGYDTSIKAIHQTRVNYGNTQLSGAQPGVFDKMLSSAAVVTVLSVQTEQVKGEMEAQKGKLLNY